MLPDEYASRRIRPFSFRIQYRVTVPSSKGYPVRKQAFFTDVHKGRFVAGDKAVPVEIGLIANRDSASVANPDLKPVHCTVVGDLDYIVISGEMKSTILYPGSFPDCQPIVFSFINDFGIDNDDAFPQKIQPTAPMDPIMHKKSR